MTLTTMTTDNTQHLLELAIKELEDLKGESIRQIDVQDLTPLTDKMVICTARSPQHLKSLSDRVTQSVKRHHYSIYAVNGNPDSGWLIVDLNGIVVHLMLAEAREFYELEKLWDQ